MKQKITFTLLLILLLVPIACNKNSVEPENDLPFLGTWVNESYQDSITVMQKSVEFDSGKYGFVFNSDGTFLERKNAGWCGTPPISYCNYSGKWEYETSNTIKIDVGYWGGQTSYIMQLVSVNKTELKFIQK